MIQVIGRVFGILEELSLDGEVSLDSLARITGLNKGTLCNILRSLIELGYVVRSRESHYALTEHFRELARTETFSAAELERMRKIVVSLAEATGESGVLSVLRGDRVAVVTQAQHSRPLMINPVEIYAALSLYHSVSGRILVAHLSPERRSSLVGRLGFPGEQWDGIDSMPALEKACRKIRREALSVMKNAEQGIIAFAVPVTRHGGFMSLGLTMPLMRCSAEMRKRIPVLLREHAAKLSG
ncbi:MAG: helix-turn-helix domain-containing protein [Lentisphaeria bacterium]|nr:helix-turn-helix domain-containing protein [Lentisphaeria bacterium]